MQQQIRFCKTADGVRLAYASVGAGEPPLVKAANWLSHVEYDWRTPVWRPFLERLARNRRVVRYDARGCGLSDWDVDEYSLEVWVRDLEAVVDAAGLKRFSLLGISQGGPIAITYAVRHPERVSRLILLGAYGRGYMKRNPTPAQVEEWRVLIDLMRIGWGRETAAFRQVFTSMFVPDGSPEQLRWFDELQRQSTSLRPAMPTRKSMTPKRSPTIHRKTLIRQTPMISIQSGPSALQREGTKMLLTPIRNPWN